MPSGCDMRRHVAEAVLVELRELFDQPSAIVVLDWLAATESRRAVVVVGAELSRLAKSAQTGSPVTPAEVPSWRDVRARLGAVDDDGDDLLGVREPSAAVDLDQRADEILCRRIDDRALAPGDAHESLFEYPVAGVVTTNRFDTLLDRGAHGWLRVLVDEDVSTVSGSDVPLIYLCGHRDHPASLLHTRSPLEVERTRPRTVALVRQLLRMHPALFLGYALDDPDLALVTGLASQGTVPGAPRVIVVTGAPSAIERRRLEERGTAVVLLRSVHPATGVKRLLGLPRRRADDVDNIVRSVRAQASFRERYLMVRDYLADADRGRDHDHSIWFACLRAAFDQTQWEQATRVRDPDVHEPLAAGLERTPAAGSFDGGLSALPPERFVGPWPLARQLDALLAGRTREPEPDLAHVAAWLQLGIDHGIAEADLPEHIDLASWAWTEATMRLPRADPAPELRRASEHAIRQAFELANRYGFDRTREHVHDDATRLGVTMAETTATAPTEQPPDRTPLTDALGRGFAALLDARFDEARRAYDEAATLAHEVDHPLAAWVALDGAGAAFAAAQDPFLPRDSAAERRRRAYRRRLETLERDVRVRSWLDRAGARRRAAEREAFEREQAREQERLLGTRSTRLNNRLHELWRSLRDLEVLGAPPHRQRIYVDLLVRAGGYSPDEELRQRLRFGLKGTSFWLERMSADGRGTVEERIQLGDSLRKVLLHPGEAASERLALLEALPDLIELLRSEDVEALATFLVDCKQRWPLEGVTYDSHMVLANRYPRAWRTLARLEAAPRTLDRLVDYRESLAHPLEKESFGATLQALPWAAWVGVAGLAPNALLTFVLDTADALELGDIATAADAGITWALWSILDAARGSDADALSGAATGRIGRWLDRIMVLPDPRGYHWHALPGAAHVGRLLGGDRWRSWLPLLLDCIGARGSPDARRFALERDAALLSALLDLEVDAGVLSDRAEMMLGELEADWREHRKFLDRNPHHMQAYAEFLVAYARSEQSRRGLVTRMLLELVEDGHVALRHLGPIARPEIWGQRWSQLVTRVAFAAGGQRGNDALGSLLSALDLWLDIERSGIAVADDLRFVVETGLTAVAHESHLVANTAGYAVVAFAEHADGAYASRVGQALRLMEADPRVSVRHAAAYGVAYLRSVAKADVVRVTAAEIDGHLSTDPIALVQRQRDRGALDARRKQCGIRGRMAAR